MIKNIIESLPEMVEEERMKRKRSNIRGRPDFQ
jgi:hypothetical protein